MIGILFDPLCFWVSPVGQKHDQEENWLGKQELKKNGKETLGDEKTQEDDYGEKWEANSSGI